MKFNCEEAGGFSPLLGWTFSRSCSMWPSRHIGRAGARRPPPEWPTRTWRGQHGPWVQQNLKIDRLMSCECWWEVWVRFIETKLCLYKVLMARTSDPIEFTFVPWSCLKSWRTKWAEDWSTGATCVLWLMQTLIYSLAHWKSTMDEDVYSNQPL